MLSVENLYCFSRDKTILESISLTFMPGMLYGVVGPNGAGKTTFLKALTGLWPNMTGSIFWQGKPLLNLPRDEISKIVIFVPHTSFHPFTYTVHELVSMGRYAYNRRYHEEDYLVEAALKAVDLAGYGHRFIDELSAGERHRVYIARAFINEAPIVILDEPSSSLDIRHQLEIWQLLNQLADQGRTVIVSEHHIPTALERCQYLIVLHKGRCLAAGPSHATLTPCLIQEVFGVLTKPVQNSVTYLLP